MSKLAKKPLPIPAGAKVSVDDKAVLVEGKVGKVRQEYASEFVNIAVNGNEILVTRKEESQDARAYQGLYFRLIQNMLHGVTEGFSKTLHIQGLGYKWEVKGKDLVMIVGFSKPKSYRIPDGITLKVQEKAEFLMISGADKQLVGKVTADIRSVRPPEPYKGKGVRYLNEQVKLKEGKAAK